MRKEVLSLSISILVLFSLLFVFGCPNTAEDNGKPVTKAEFLSTLTAAQQVSIIMDARNAPSAGSDRVLQCGVDLAGSEGLAGKNLSIYAFDKTGACFGKKNTSVSECLSEAKGSTILQVKYGPENVSFFENKMIVFVNENTTAPCLISVKNVSDSAQPS